MTFTAKREDVAPRLDHIELLRAMYPPSQDEMHMTEETETLLSNARKWVEDDTADPPSLTPLVSLSLSLQIRTTERDVRTLPPPPSPPPPLLLLLNIDLPLAPTDPETPPPQSRLRVSADWLTRAQAARLQDDMPEDDIAAAIEHVRDRASESLAALQRSASVVMAPAEGIPGAEVQRSWFYFPSISTREKRDDLVNHAPSYGLTGFLLAGKPGVLCLEGQARKIDEFIKFIKTESWANIPAGHKKVSEVLRETRLEQRSFAGMEEITDQLAKRGERSNRSDMKALEQWLGERGLGQVFAKVLM